MSDPTPPSTSDLLRLSAQIVAAHVSKNAVSPTELPTLIRNVHAALAGVGQPADVAPGRPEPAVPIRRSVFPDHIVCLEDGAKMITLKRYLRVRFGLTPEQYRSRWSLPPDYPMVAPDYTARRSVLAKQNGLGRKGRPVPEPVAPPKKRGRPPKLRPASAV